MRNVAFLLCGALLVVGSLAARLRAEGLEKRAWKVDGVSRDAIVYIPKGAGAADSEKKLPLVFVFHGHGGTSRHAVATFGIHTEWPEAVCVYPQGLNTPGRLTDPEGKKPGWQHGAGEQGDRDLKFFDTMLKELSDQLPIDEKRVFSTGHSNGGGFTYLLWAERGDRLAAVAPSASAAAGRIAGGLKPKPAMHIAGKNDNLVRFVWQEQTIVDIVRINECESKSEAWRDQMQVYRSASGTPVVSYIHDGAHNFPADAPHKIVTFFKNYAEIPAKSAQ